MRKRYLSLGLAIVLALAVAVPAIGQSSDDPTATTSFSSKKKEKKQNKRIRKAKKKAKKANKRSKRALNIANQALNETNALEVRVTNIEQAGVGGAGPQGPAGPAGPQGPGGPGQAFGDSLDNETRTINGGTWEVRFRADSDGVCDQVRVRNLGTEDGAFFLTVLGTFDGASGEGVTSVEEVDAGDSGDTFDPIGLAKYELDLVSPQGVKQVQFALLDDDFSNEDECVITGTTTHLP